MIWSAFTRNIATIPSCIGHRQEHLLLQLSHPVTKIVPSQETAPEMQSAFYYSDSHPWRIGGEFDANLFNGFSWIMVCVELTAEDVAEFPGHHFWPRICEAHVFQPLPLEGCRIARGPRGWPRHYNPRLRPIVAGLCLATSVTRSFEKRPYTALHS